MRWGLRVMAKARTRHQVVQLPWILDTIRAVACASGRCASALIRGVDATAAASPTAAADAEQEGKTKAAEKVAVSDVVRFTPASDGAGDATAVEGVVTAVKDDGTCTVKHGDAETSDVKGDEVTVVKKAVEAPVKSPEALAAEQQRRKRAVAKWLGCELISGGLPSARVSGSSDDTLSAMLHSLSSSSDGKAAVTSADWLGIGSDGAQDALAGTELEALIEALRVRMAEVTVTKFKVGAKAKAAVKRVISGVVAVMLRHNLLEEAARDFVATTPAEAIPEPPAPLVRVWKTSHRITRWLRQQMQMRLLEETRALQQAADEEEARQARERELASDSKAATGAEQDSKEPEAAPSKPKRVSHSALYKRLAGPIVERCMFLCEIAPVPLPMRPPARPTPLRRTTSQSSDGTQKSRTPQPSLC